MNLSVKAELVVRPRGVERLVRGTPTSDGAGVKLTRVFSSDLQRRLDPFLMLDAFGTDRPEDYIAGFPPHPHRGFETVTYMLAGRLRHRDSTGGEGLLQQGGVQWMTAGAGLIHSEMPEQQEGLMSGFQLWLNLPARDKMTAPGYRDVSEAEIPVIHTQAGAQIRLVAGRSHGVDGPIQRAVTEPFYAKVSLGAQSQLEQPLPSTHNAFAYVYEGAVRSDGRVIPAGQMAIFQTRPEADGIVIESEEPARLLLIAGRPLGEAIVQYGPFVMNTHAQIEQAIDDYNAGRMGRIA